jgi:predicted metalloprotease with PDZ domain
MAFIDRGSEIPGPTLRGSPLYAAGLDRGDRLVEADGKPLKTRGDLDDLAASHKPGDRTMFLAETRAGRRQVEITWVQEPDLEVVTFEAAGKPLTPAITAFRDAWLGSKALRPLPKVD